MRTKGFDNIRTPVKTPRKVGRRRSPEELQERLQQGGLNRKDRRALKATADRIDGYDRDDLGESPDY